MQPIQDLHRNSAPLPAASERSMVDLVNGGALMDLRTILVINRKEIAMLYYALVFFIVALIAAVFGFGGIATAAAGIAKILFFVFLVLFIVSLLTGLIRRPPV